MKSPFPGMDPWLEGADWQDLHNSLAIALKEQLVPKVAPHYIVRVEIQVVFDPDYTDEINIFYPDVELLKKQKPERPDIVSEPETAYELSKTPSTMIIPLPVPVELKIPFLEIREPKSNNLITVIEILSPANKRNPNLAKYRKKRAKLVEEGIHLLEIDLLRRGERPLQNSALPKEAHYFVMLQRSGQMSVEVWAMTVRDPLPIVPVPLAAPTADVLLDLGQAMRDIYQRSRYDLSIDYNSTPPPPNFSEEDKKWIEQILQEKKLKADG